MRTIRDIIANFDSLAGFEIKTKGRVFAIRKMKTMFFADIVYQKVKIQLIYLNCETFNINEGDMLKF